MKNILSVIGFPLISTLALNNWNQGLLSQSPYNSFGLKNCFMFTVLAFNIKIFDTFSICVSPPLSMKEAAKIMHICSVIIYPLEKNNSLHWNKQHL